MTPSLPKKSIRSWRSRAELRQAYLDSLSPEELRRVHPTYYWLRFGRDSWKRENTQKANFHPEQPRGDSGRWVDSASAAETFAAARRRGRSIAFCTAQYAIDSLMCNSVESVSRRAACWKQAAERFGDCLAGRQIPPLNF